MIRFDQNMMHGGHLSCFCFGMSKMIDSSTMKAIYTKLNVLFNESISSSITSTHTHNAVDRDMEKIIQD